MQSQSVLQTAGKEWVYNQMKQKCRLFFTVLLSLSIGMLQSVPVYAEQETLEEESSGEETFEVMKEALESISLNRSVLALREGGSFSLTVSFSPETAAEDIEWTVDDTSIATVSDGTVTAVSAGSTRVVAQAENDVYAVCYVHVVPEEHIYGEGVNDSSVFVVDSEYASENNLNSAPVVIWAPHFQDRYIEVAKENYPGYDPITGYQVYSTWYEDNTVTEASPFKITGLPADVSASDAEDIMICYIGNGVFPDLKDSVSDGSVSFTSGQGIFYVLQKESGIALNSINLNKDKLSLNTGESETLTVAYDPENTTEDKTVTWTSSDTSVCTVSDEGLVSAVSVGIATVTAAVGNYSAECQVTVQFNDVTNPDEFYYDFVYNMVGRGIVAGWDDGTFRPYNDCNRAAVVTFLWRLMGKPESAGTASFSDLTGNADFDKAISWASEQGITTGWNDNTFRPWVTCNRAAVVTFLWRAAGKPEPGDPATFSDMTGNGDFDKAISWAAENGITTGWDDNTFRPWRTCNRLAVVSFLSRYDALRENQQQTNR